MDVKVLGLTWTPRMSQMQTLHKQKMQAFIDETVIKEMSPYVPVRTGELSKSVIRGSVVGSGLLVFAIPYARRQYYLKNRKIVVGKRDSLWIDRMKEERMQDINYTIKARARRIDKYGR